MTLPTNRRGPVRITALVFVLSVLTALLASCGVGGLGGSSSLYVPDLLKNAAEHNGKDVTVDGAYLERSDSCASCLAFGVSTLDNGLDAQPLGDIIWLEGFPATAKEQLHQPGDAIYGFVRINGKFETGSFGPDQQYQYRIQVTSADPIEQVRRKEVRVPSGSLGDGKVSLKDLVANPDQYQGQTVTTRGYYFWNGPIAVLAEGVSTEEDGSSPQPLGDRIWIDGFPPDISSQLNLGPNNSFVWGYIEATGQFSTGGGFGKDGAYRDHFQITGETIVLEQSK